jgi:rubredoxin
MHLARKSLIDWYVRKDLAELVTDDPPTIRLKFQPNGLGHAGHEFYLIPRENKCVVCGATERLTRHHVVPGCYWRHIPKRFKSGSSHDVLATCSKCHFHYEREFGDPRKLELSQEYNSPIQGEGWYIDKFIYRVRGAARTLKKHEDKLPSNVREDLWQTLETHLGRARSTITRQDMKEAGDAQPFVKTETYASHGMMIVRQLKDVWAFIEMWRQHFIDSMDPQYMPPGWTVDHKVRHNERKKLSKSNRSKMS